MVVVEVRQRPLQDEAEEKEEEEKEETNIKSNNPHVAGGELIKTIGIWQCFSCKKPGFNKILKITSVFMCFLKSLGKKRREFPLP